MAALEVVLGFLGAGGGLSGVGAIFKTWLDKSEVKKKLDKLEQETLPAFKAEMTAALAQFPTLERRATEAVAKLETTAAATVAKVETTARAASRASRSGTGADNAQLGAAMAELAALRRELEALRQSVDSVRLVQPAGLARLTAIEERFTNFETAYHEDYGELREKVAGFAGEFKQAMRGRNAARPSTDSGG